MRVRFRILPLKGGKRISGELKIEDKNLAKAVRYLSEFKYLEATKWLMLAEESFEKYALLYLIYTALGQGENAEEFYELAIKGKKATDLTFRLENPERGWFVEIKSGKELNLWHTKKA
jgi:hypothetical protein